MSSWRYGISKIVYGSSEMYKLVEKYTLYGVEMSTADPITFVGDDPQEIIRSLERALRDVKAELSQP